MANLNCADIAQSENKVVVYHGSTSLLEQIDVNKGKPYKDFGRGFYVTKSKSHASKIALRNMRIETERYGTRSEAYLHTYELDLSALTTFRVKIFVAADLEWLQFVLANRKSRNRTHNYDVVIGPTANDDTMVVINAYLDGLYGEIGSTSALHTLQTNIEAENLPGQIYFSNQNAADLLILKEQAVKL
jgi:hypothetical protein